MEQCKAYVVEEPVCIKGHWGDEPGKAETPVMIPKSEYSLLNGSGDYGNMIIRRENNAKKTKNLIEGIHCVCCAVCHRTCIQCDAHHGGLPAGGILRGVGSHLPAVSDRRIYFT